MVDPGLLNDDQLKAKLLQYGVKAGPIVASTRALYEKKLKRLLDSSAQASQHRVNGIRDEGLYSDNEEEEDKDSESEQLRSEMMARTETSKTASRHKSSNATQNGSLSQSGSPYRSFSITQMVEEGSIETRFSPQSKQTEIERRSGQRSEQTDFMRLDKDTMTGRSLCLTSPSFHQKRTVTVTAFSPLSLPLLSSGSASSFVLTLSVDPALYSSRFKKLSSIKCDAQIRTSGLCCSVVNKS
uniref:Uncharacterized LOC107560863 n=1 Tax=Sinocyclocheilus grahami TaxID=75366 RepID=A0A672N1F6_SINGR